MEIFDLIIIGGGFSGILLSYHVKTLAPNMKVGIIHPAKHLGGLAYSQATSSAVLNVPHWKMSALVDDSENFSKFVKDQNCPLQDQAFARRQDYLIYLQKITAESQLAGTHLIEGEALAISKNQNIWDVKLASKTLHCKLVVLALGNFPPSSFNSNPAKHFIQNDPWKPGVIQSLLKNKQITIIGTGLTAVDIVWELFNQNYQGEITLVSRRGLTPMSHDLNQHPMNWDGPVCSPLLMLRHFKQQIGTNDWRSVIDSLRPITQETWQAWDLTLQKQFIRHLRPYWDVARHRLAPTLANTLETLKSDGRLIIKRGRILEITSTKDQSQAIIKFKNNTSLITDQIMNCSGSQSLSTQTSPLIASILNSGYAQIDDLKLGFKTDHVGRILGARENVTNLYTIGPLRKGTLWESIAVPELRPETIALAKTLIQDLHSKA